MAIATSFPRPGHLATPSKEVHISTNEDEKNWLVVSPYNERPHQLDLRRVDTSCQLLAKALVNMRSLRDDYVTAPYAETFNFDECAEELRTLVSDSGFEWKEKDFYIVVFRSQIPPTTVYSDLGVLDKAAHEEAIASGGFLKYWFGTPNDKGRNLATCVWRNQQDARIGSVGEAHKRAAGATRFLYSEWSIERIRLLITNDAKEWKVSEWSA